MDELINRAAEAQGITPELVERSAKARAAAKGVSAEALLIEWAGGEAAEATTAPAPTTDVPTADAAPEPAPASAAPAEEAPAEPSGAKVEVLGPTSDEPSDEISEDESLAEEEPEPVGAGMLAGFPSWLVAAFFVVPMIAMFYALLAPDGPDCGASGQLALDPVSGEAVNCDGSAYGTEFADFFSVGEQLYVAHCAACHGDAGGGGTGPAFTGGAVLAVFPEGSCVDHIEWVTVGTSAWPEPTYGAQGTAPGSVGIMPGFGDRLSEEDLASVVLYERVAFGGEALAEAEGDCMPEEDGETVTAPEE